MTKQFSAETLEREIAWFEKILELSLSLYFEDADSLERIFEFQPPDLTENTSAYANLILENELDFSERLVLIMAIIPILKPQALDLLLVKNTSLGTEYSEFGRYKNTQQCFIPTLETACFILTGTKLSSRLQFINTFNRQHLFFRLDILMLDIELESHLQQKLQVTPEFEHLIITGSELLPGFSSKFPAHEISTKCEWADLVVNEEVQEDLYEIQDWLLYCKTILEDWGMGNSIKPGYRALFYGPPGTGKTMAATLLGKMVSCPVFRVDLSAVVSKYIGETEKNLGKLFDVAASKRWILFFDEADALFGKRTQTKGANDRYANQEVAYLLHRIEDFDGLIILATNMQGNIDEAFNRRFQKIIYFPRPEEEQRKRLWRNLLFKYFKMNEQEHIEDKIFNYELSGGEIINVLRYCALQAAKRNEKTTNLNDILTGIKREYNKENKTI